MPQPLLIVVTGQPCTGKTSLARRLAADLGLPLVSRDDIKERLFDSLGWSDRAWSRRLGQASYDLLYYTAELLLCAGQPLILESNFSAVHSVGDLRRLKQTTGCATLVIHCRTEWETLAQRFRQRSASGERHPGHVDDQVLGETLAEIQRRLAQREDAPLDLGGPVLPLDTTDFAAIDYPALRATVATTLAGPATQPGRSKS
jgi:predicted kinase